MGLTPDDIDAGVQVLIESPKRHFNTKLGLVNMVGKQRGNGTINRYIASMGTLYKLLKLHRVA